MRSPLHTFEFRRVLVALFLTTSLSSASLADEEQTRARKAFEAFAVTWMETVQEHATPNITGQGTGAGLAYRQYEDDFTTEIRATGSENTPFVGVLRYRESLYQCTGPGSEGCAIVSSAPVTEIFRYENDSWLQ
ncbi:hypothetical protein MK489_15510 [Myxococcota bacterium]|nr:hypothetical protein [Myxococcota bacterium]